MLLTFNAQRVLVWLLNRPESEPWSAPHVPNDVCPPDDVGAVREELSSADLIASGSESAAHRSNIFAISEHHRSSASRAVVSYRDNLAQVRLLDGVNSGLDSVDAIAASERRHDFSGDISEDEFRQAAQALVDDGLIRATTRSWGNTLGGLTITLQGRNILLRGWAPADLSAAAWAGQQPNQYNHSMTITGGNVGAVQQGQHNIAEVQQHNQLTDRMHPTLERIREQIQALPYEDDRDVLTSQVDQLEKAAQEGKSPAVLKRLVTAAADSAAAAAGGAAVTALAPLFDQLLGVLT